MTLDKLADELADVKDSMAAALMDGQSDDERRTLRTVNMLQNTIINQPLNADTLVNIRTGWAEMHNHDVQGHRANVLLRNQHAATMLYNYTMWNWLDVYLAAIASSILEGQDLGNSKWLTKLLEAVNEMYLFHIQSRTFIAVNYGLSLPSIQHTVTNGSSWPRTKKTTQHAIIQTVVEIVQSWLSFPDHRNARPQAWFVHAIISQFGVEMLFLDHIWQTHTQVTRTLYRRGIWKLDTFADIKPLVDVAPSHALFNKSSSERKIVQELANLIHKFSLGELMLQELGGIDQPNGVTPLDRLPIELRLSGESRLRMFRDFIRDSVGFVVSSSNSLTAAHPEIAGASPVFPKLRVAMSKDPDFTLPFRELAPGRIRFSQQDGPYHPTVIRTTRGIYSALIWRAITFNTAFAATGPKIFNSYADFERAQEDAGSHPPEYFCNKAAYGVSDHGRNVANAGLYWNALQGELWPTLVNDRTLSFKECYDFFSFRSKGKDGARFMHLGGLGSYLITADLVYAGVVSPLTKKDLGWIVRHLNKGAASGLIELGLISRPSPTTNASNRPKPSQEECEEGIRRVFEIMEEVVPTELHAYFIIDLITVEHTLCKFSRAFKRRWLGSV